MPMNKSKLLAQAKRELEEQRCDKPTILTQETEDRYVKYETAEHRKVCPICGTEYGGEFVISILSEQWKDWKIRRKCKCGITEETPAGIRITGDKTLGGSASDFQDAMKKLGARGLIK